MGYCASIWQGTLGLGLFELLNVQMAFIATTFMWKAIKESELWAQCWDHG